MTNSKHPRVGGNQLFLICTICGPAVADALFLGERDFDSGYSALADRRGLDKFFERHTKCGGVKDKFKLALGHVAEYDNDLIDPQTNIKGAVRLALVKP